VEGEVEVRGVGYRRVRKEKVGEVSRGQERPTQIGGRGGAEHPMATRSSGRKAERHTANPKSVGAKAVVGGGEDRELW
jgi:hypothetical protein